MILWIQTNHTHQHIVGHPTTLADFPIPSSNLLPRVQSNPANTQSRTVRVALIYFDTLFFVMVTSSSDPLTWKRSNMSAVFMVCRLELSWPMTVLAMLSLNFCKLRGNRKKNLKHLVSDVTGEHSMLSRSDLRSIGAHISSNAAHLSYSNLPLLWSPQMRPPLYAKY